MRVQSFSFAGQNFQVKTLDCSTTLPTTIMCDTLEISIASEVYASINNTLNLVIDDGGAYLLNGVTINNFGYPEGCCQYLTFFRHSSQSLQKGPSPLRKHISPWKPSLLVGPSLPVGPNTPGGSSISGESPFPPGGQAHNGSLHSRQGEQLHQEASGA